MSAADAVLSLVSGLPREKREAWQIVALQAFIDDSGSEPQSHSFVLAGFIASVSAWADFSDEWGSALKKPPSLAYFKMSEANSMRGEFDHGKGWNKELRDKRVSQLMDIISRYALFRVSASIKHEDFNVYLRSHDAPVRNLGTDSPYVFLFQQVISLTAMFSLRLRLSEATDFVFDTQLGFTDNALRLWSSIGLTMERSNLPDAARFLGQQPIFRDEKLFLPLQAADLFAWHWRRHIEDNRHHTHLPRPVLRRIVENIPGISYGNEPNDMASVSAALDRAQAAYDGPLVPYGGKAARRRSKP